MMRVMIAVVAAVVWAGLASAAEPAKAPGLLGVEMRDLTKEEADKLGFDQPTGVWVVKPAPGSPAEKAGILADDVILLIDGQEIVGQDKFRETVGSKGAGVEVKFRLLRQGKFRTVTATLAARPAEAAAEPARNPLQLMLDTGGHTALIRGLAWTPDGKQIVSAGNDKVIRVWDAATGRTVRTIRGEAGPGQEGKIFALALSPDGRWLAVGGFMAEGHGVRDEAVGDIRLYDFATGQLVRLLKGHTNVVYGLAVSPDGTRLISGSGDRTAIIWDVATGQALHRLEGHRGEIYAVGFTPDGQHAVTGSFDTTLKLWDTATGRLLTTMTGHTDKVQMLAVSPRGDVIASGDRSGAIRLWDAATGTPVKVLIGNQDRGIGTLSFSPDGSRLVATASEGHGERINQVWDIAIGKSLVTYTSHDNIVLAAAFSPDGRSVATGGGNNHEIHIWDPGLRSGAGPTTGTRRNGPDGQPLALAGSGRPTWAVGISADVGRIGWGNTWQKLAGGTGHSSETGSPLEFALRLPTGTTGLAEPVTLDASDNPKTESDWRRAEVKQSGVTLRHRKGGAYGLNAVLDVVRDGSVVASLERDSTNGNDHSAYTFSPDGATIVTGGANGFIQAFDLATIEAAVKTAPDHVLKGDDLDKLARPFVGHVGDIWALATSPDGRFLVSGSADQTVRLWNLKTGESIVTIFLGTDSEWVAWTEQGYFTGSPGAGRIVGWQLNQGPEREARYITGDQISEHFDRPDIVARAIQLASAKAAIAEAKGTDFKLEDLDTKGPPRVELVSVDGRVVSPSQEVSSAAERATIVFRLKGTRDRPWRSYEIRDGGDHLFTRSRDDVESPDGEIREEVALKHGLNQITIIAANADRLTSDPTEGRVRITATGRGGRDKAGTLRIVAVGVDKFPGLRICGKDGQSSCDLKYASSDAAELVRVMKETLGPRHSAVEVTLLSNGPGSDGQPTDVEITRALRHVANVAEDIDTTVVIAASHGVNIGADYYLMGSSAEREGRGYKGGVLWSDIKTTLEATRGKRIMFLDTCHSGGAYSGYMDGVRRAANKADIVAYTATNASDSALESTVLNEGLFTYAVSNGLFGGQAAPAGQHAIRVDDLGEYLKRVMPSFAHTFVPNYSGTIPVPAYVRGSDADNYVLTER